MSNRQAVEALTSNGDNSLGVRIDHGVPGWRGDRHDAVAPDLSQRELRLLGRHRPAQQVSLSPRTTQIGQHFQLLFRLDPLGDNVNSQLRPQ